MGYCYGRSDSGRMKLACDRCSTLEGVRKRPCSHKVDGLPYCPAPALCGPCLKDVGGSRALHAQCEDGARRMQAEADHKRARLEAGDFAVGGAFGSWHENVPNGMVGVIFRGADGAEVMHLIPDEDYDPSSKGFLSDYDTKDPWIGPDAVLTDAP
jgi:hypothetical protein